MRASFIERNQQLLDKYGHLLDGAKHFTNNPRLNELEENKLAVLLTMLFVQHVLKMC